MPLDLEKKIQRNLQIFRSLWTKKQHNSLSSGQRVEIRTTIRAIRKNTRALTTERTARRWILEARVKSKKENKMLGIDGYYIREYPRDDS